jgi:uncharacterized protein YigE (DUF2233 family)
MLLPGLLFCVAVMAACSVVSQPDQHTQVTPSPTAQASAQRTTLSADPFDSGWIESEVGIALRQQRVFQPDGSEARISIVRLDPASVRFRVGYAPDQPQSLATWAAEAGALAAINGGFFGENYETTALVISGGTIIGTSYQGFGGMFAVDAAEHVSLRYLADQPYDPGEHLIEAVQGWPMLVKSGGVIAYTTIEGSEPARRSVIARDRHGHVLLIACSTSSFTLPGLATWLLESDLEIDTALNLDGGSSTSLYLESGSQYEYIRSFGSLPLVVLVLPR